MPQPRHSFYRSRIVSSSEHVRENTRALRASLTVSVTMSITDVTLCPKRPQALSQASKDGNRLPRQDGNLQFPACPISHISTLLTGHDTTCPQIGDQLHHPPCRRPPFSPWRPGYAAYTPPAPIVSRHHHSNAKPVPEHGSSCSLWFYRCACRSLHEAVHTRRSKSEIALAAEAALVAPHPTPLGDSSLNGVSLTGRVQAMAQIGNRRLLWLRTVGWA
jgi:hypothetical protein